MRKLLIGFVLATSSCRLAYADPLPCSSPKIQQDNDISLEEMVRRADGIFYAQAVGFRYETRSDGLDGVYEFAALVELKTIALGVIEIPGMEPYSYLPQSYIDLTERHTSFDRHRVRLGGTSIAETDESCVVAPRFFMGYNYLIFTGLQSYSAFEPVHSPLQDFWFQSVKEEAIRQSEY